MAALDDLNTVKSQLIAQLKNITLNPKLSYSLDGQSVSWSDYQRWLVQAISEVNKLIQIEGGIVELETQAFSW